jgi:N4-gp56 family major capsid protein
MALTTIGTTASPGSLQHLISPVVQEALFVASERSIMRGLVRNYTVPFNNGKVYQIPKYPTASAIAIAEGTDLASSAGDITISTSVSNIELSEIGIMTVLTDMARNTSESNVIADLGKLFGEAIARKIDQDLIQLFSGFSTSINTNGPAATELTVAHLFQANATLKNAAVPGPYFGVFSPKAIYNLKANLTNTFANPNAGVLQNQAMVEGYVGRIAGIDIFESSNVGQSTAESAGLAINGVFSRDALGIAIMQDLKIATQRQESKRADDVVCTAVYGVAELHDTYGVKIFADNTI